jgi:DNA-binding CsgD family transcriptional regulator/Tfp pilus assembly protein PilN
MVKNNNDSAEAEKQNPLIDTMYRQAGVGQFKEALKTLEKVEKVFQEREDSSGYVFLYYERGKVQYALANFEEAEKSWLQGLRLAEQMGKTADAAGLNTNLGAIYMQKGYTKTAIDYFTQARESMELLGKKDYNYWMNYLNIGVAFMGMEQYAEADSIFDRVRLGSSNGLSFLYYLNRAKLSGLKGEQAAFNKNVDSAQHYLINENMVYEQFFNEMKLEFYLQFKDVNRLKNSVNQFRESTEGLSSFMGVLLNKAALMTEGKPISSFEDIQKTEKEIKSSGNYNLSVAYHDFLADYYKSKGNYAGAAQELQKAGLYKDSLKKESSEQTVSDLMLLMKKSELAKELKLLKTENELKSTQIRIQTYILGLVGLVAVFLCVVFVLYYKNSKKNKHLKEAELITKNQLLQQTQKEQQKLEENLRLGEEKLQEIINNINKIAVLKKQIENFIDELEQNVLMKEQKARFKKAKVNLDAFFNNYADLAVIAAFKNDDISKFQQFITHFSEVLSEHEMQVLMLVYNQFTTKEIGVLLSKSDKGIEYTRTQIRRKLNIPAEVSLNEFLDGVSI